MELNWEVIDELQAVAHGEGSLQSFFFRGAGAIVVG